MTTRREHWDAVYATKAFDAVSWHRPRLDASLRWIEALRLPPRSAIIDVGAGASNLLLDLLDLGFTDVTALDVSDEALKVARHRAGGRAGAIEWIVADITACPLASARYDLWHDRAVLHFLVGEGDRAAYADAAARAIRPGGHALISGFAPDGPTRCSDLDVLRAGPEAIAATLGPRFRLLHSSEERHHTPWGKEQAFAYAVLRREP